MDKIYLDYNATSVMKPDVLQCVFDTMQHVGNASSVHDLGRQARKKVEKARHQVAELCHTNADRIIFTSGATESINTVLSGYRDRRVLTSAIEHPAVIAAAPHAQTIPVTEEGLIDMDAYKDLLHQDEPPALISIVMVNSETGVVQPIADMAQLAHDVGARFHTDAVQAAGRINLDFEKLNVDYMSLSAHKFSGPQGVGALIYKEGVELPKFMVGGGQEKNCRAGTHNTAGIVGMGMAADLALKQVSTYKSITKLRDDLERQLRLMSNKIKIYGENAERVGNTSNFGLSGMPAQTQMMALDLDGICVSSGSACSSGSFKASHVLRAMGASEEDAKSALRISLGWATTSADIDAFLASYRKIVERLK